jgi:hypothetical protein
LPTRRCARRPSAITRPSGAVGVIRHTHLAAARATIRSVRCPRWTRCRQVQCGRTSYQNFRVWWPLLHPVEASELCRPGAAHTAAVSRHPALRGTLSASSATRPPRSHARYDTIRSVRCPRWTARCRRAEARAIDRYIDIRERRIAERRRRTPRAAGGAAGRSSGHASGTCT